MVAGLVAVGLYNIVGVAVVFRLVLDNRAELRKFFFKTSNLPNVHWTPLEERECLAAM